MKSVVVQIIQPDPKHETAIQKKGWAFLDNKKTAFLKEPSNPVVFDGLIFVFDVHKQLLHLSTLLAWAHDYDISFRISSFENELDWQDYPLKQ